MIKTFYKITLLTLFICGFSIIAKAQIGYDYSVYDVGFSGGINSVGGDATPKKSTASVNINIGINATPFTNFVFEAQLGRFAGGDSTIAEGRQFTSSFSAFILRGQLQFGEFLDYDGHSFMNGVKNFYVSAGVGYLVNHITRVTRESNTIPGLYTPGKDNINVPFVPLRVGYEFKFYNRYQQPSFKVDLAYQYGYVFSDNVDGYATGPKKDVFTQISLGVKFAIGGDIVSYKKQIHY